MSYSFSHRAATRSALYALCVASMADVVEQQPIHAISQLAALHNLNTQFDLLNVDEYTKPGYELNAIMGGFIKWREDHNGGDVELLGVSIAASVGWVQIASPVAEKLPEGVSVMGSGAAHTIRDDVPVYKTPEERAADEKGMESLGGSASYRHEAAPCGRANEP